MLYSRKYSRLFITLRQDNSGLSGQNRPAAGRCVIEIRNSRCKMMLFAQGLKTKVLYRVIPVKKGEGENIGLNAGLLKIDDKGKAQVSIELDPDNVMGSGFKIEELEAVVILAEGTGELTAPLSGFVASPFEWRTNFRLYNDDKEENTAEGKNDIKTDIKDEKDDKNIVQDESNSENDKSLESDVLDAGENKEKQENNIKPQTNESKSENVKEENTDKAKDSSASTNTEDMEKNFSVFVDRFKRDMIELEKYTKMADTRICAMRGRGIDGVEYIKTHNTKIKPFENTNSNICWYKILPCEMMAVKRELWRHTHSPFVNSCFRKYKHLILGIEDTQKGEQYYIGVPERYDNSFAPEAEKQGFCEFWAREDVPISNGVMGYWILKVD